MSIWKDPRDQDPREPELPRWIFLHALRSTLGRTPVWLIVGGVTALLAILATAPWLTHYRSAIDSGYESGTLLVDLDETFRVDNRSARGVVEAATASLSSLLAFVAALFGTFAAGGWLQVFLEHTQGESVRKFFYGGARFFFRFVRVWLLTLLLLQLLGWLCYGAPWNLFVLENLFDLAKHDLKDLPSEATARRIVLAQDGLYFVGTMLLFAWGDLTRTRLAAHGTKSALWAGLCTIALLVTRPLRALRPLALITLCEATALWLAGELTASIDASLTPTSSAWPVLGMFALGLTVFFVRTVTRGARYSACVLVTRDYVRPLTRPDPWKHSIGGPGGPRYPIDGDEYGVAL
jgi:hypothetical protein